MDDVLRTLRGLMGVGATWAIAWGAIGALVGLVLGVLSPDLWTIANPITGWAMGMAAYGAVSGVGFGALLAYRERRKSLDELTPARAGVWGILGAIAVPLLFLWVGMFEAGTTALDVLEAMGLTAVLGGTFAAGSVALARGAEKERALEGGSPLHTLGPARTHQPTFNPRSAAPSRDSAVRRDPSRS